MKPYFIHIEWEGPLPLGEVRKKDTKKDYGVYAVYGATALYGSDKLLYIGQAAHQVFARRVPKHWDNWMNWNADASNMTLYLGRLMLYPNQEEDDLEDDIDKAERLLIYAHMPARNSSRISKALAKELEWVHLLNWGSHRDLMPEVSGARWTERFNSLKGFRSKNA